MACQSPTEEPLEDVISCEGLVWPTQIDSAQGAVVVADTGRGQVLVVDRVGNSLGGMCMASILPDDCQGTRADGSASCHVFDVTFEQDGMLLSYSSADTTSGIFYYNPSSQQLDWRIEGLRFQEADPLLATCLVPNNGEPLCRLRMPHAARWTLDGQALVVADTLNNRVLFLDPPVDGLSEVKFVLDDATSGWGAARWPNGVSVMESPEGRMSLLVTYKGSDPVRSGDSLAGRIMLWDIDDVMDPDWVWAFPEEGYLAAVHNGQVQPLPDGRLALVYSHSLGAGFDFGEGGQGSVGLGLMSFEESPTYISDLVASGPRPLGFVRDAEFIGDSGRVLITDSGCERPSIDCEKTARLLELEFEMPEIVGLSGAFSGDHEQQQFQFLSPIGGEYKTVLSFPFEADVVDIAGSDSELSVSVSGVFDE